MKDKWYPVWLLIRREVRDQMRDWRVILPIVLLTLSFPFLMNVSATYSVRFVNKYGADLVASRLLLFFVLVVGFFPITISLVVALETFVGEKERGTIEPLLSTPLDDWQLYAGKFIAAIFLPLLASFMDIGIYLVMMFFKGADMPEAWLLVDTLIFTLIEALVMVSGAIFVSTQSSTVRSANLMASFIVIPMALLLDVESGVLFFGEKSTFLLTIGIMLMIVILLIRLGVAHFRRELLLGRRTNAFDLNMMWQTFWDEFSGGARTLRGLYAEGWRTIRELRRELGIVLLIAALTVVATWCGAHALAARSAGAHDPSKLGAEVWSDMVKGSPLLSMDINFHTLFLHNLRSILLQIFVGFFSFAILGLFLFVINFVMLGGVLAVLDVYGYNAGAVFLYGILPHGVFELTAMFLAAAVVFHAGVVLVTPQLDRTLGEVALVLMVKVSKIFVLFVVPLLAIAAVIEAYFTPTFITFLKM